MLCQIGTGRDCGPARYHHRLQRNRVQRCARLHIRLVFVPHPSPLQCVAHGRSETTVVRMGPWADGGRANRTDLALAFYLNGKLVKQYSTLDIAGKPDDVGRSVSHYTVFSSVDGFQWQDDGALDFIATRVDGMRMRFAADTGQRVREQP